MNGGYLSTEMEKYGFHGIVLGIRMEKHGIHAGGECRKKMVFTMDVSRGTVQ
jgi:hypothetical protein